MPTPFTHLATAARILNDARVPPSLHAALMVEKGAFLLGNIAADARVSSGIERAQTHFYSFDRPITEHPWRVMLARFPQLTRPTSMAQRVFLAGYVAHLAMDEVWSVRIVRPYFGEGAWGTPAQRFLLLNALLVRMDLRDYAALADWQRLALLEASPHGWLPFMTDMDLAGWRDFVGAQLPPDGESQTLAVIGERIGYQPAALQALVASADAMTLLWDNVPEVVVTQAERAMREQSLLDMLTYWQECGE